MTTDSYEFVIPVYIDDDMSVVYQDISIKGEGAWPKILFDRKQIILPIVPLGFEARATFKIINDGYENLNLEVNIP